MEQHLHFNSNGLRLHGILHIPDKNIITKKTWINILNPGLKNRVAPNRLNIKIARMLCKNGFYVFRFDPKGIGDSEGDLSNNNDLVINLWGDIQKGLFVDDTIESIKFITNTINIEKVIVVGLCGGAITAILSAYRNKNINGLVMINTPVRIDTLDINITDKKIEQAQFHEIIKNILKKDSWDKFYNLHRSKGPYSFVKYISEFLFKKLVKLFKYNNILPTSDRFNYKFFYAFNKLVNRIKILFIFSENDILYREFNSDMLNYINKYKNNEYFQINIINHANHIFSEEKWQSELLNCIDDWVKKCNNE